MDRRTVRICKAGDHLSEVTVKSERKRKRARRVREAQDLSMKRDEASRKSYDTSCIDEGEEEEEMREKGPQLGMESLTFENVETDTT